MPGITAGNRFGASTCALAVTGGRYSQSRVALRNCASCVSIH